MNPSDDQAFAETSSPIAANPAHDSDPDLHPIEGDYRNVLRISTLLASLPFVIGSMVLETALSGEDGFVAGTIALPVIVLALLTLLWLPVRRWQRWGYRLTDQHLRVARGYMLRTDTIVPLSRIQHIDVAEGPLERIFGLATLIVHTAGTHNSTVSLPGLLPEQARTMRDTIRAKILAEA